DRSGNRQAAVASGVAVAVGGGAGGARLAEAPVSGQAFAAAASQDARMRLRGGAREREVVIREAEQQALGVARVDGRAAAEVGRGSRDAEQRGGDQAASRRLGDGDRLAALAQQLARTRRRADVERYQWHSSPPVPGDDSTSPPASGARTRYTERPAAHQPYGLVIWRRRWQCRGLRRGDRIRA